MKAAILGAGLFAGTITGAFVGFLVQWEVTDFLIRHSPYRNYSNGHLFHR
jgi:hypothetical protein